jgi:hypothetical protein
MSNNEGDTVILTSGAKYDYTSGIVYLKNIEEIKNLKPTGVIYGSAALKYVGGLLFELQEITE